MPLILNQFVALLGLIALAPVTLTVALCVWLESGGPVLFRQRRVGWQGRDFTLFKFRSMSVRKDAEQGLFEAGSTARVTRVGRWLRKTKLDELPQLWNVVCGDMTLVGPRPEVRPWVEAYPARWAQIHTVRPGITDPASIEFRDEEQILAAAANPDETYRNVILPRKLELYEQYLARRSFAYDLAVIGKTIRVVLLGGGNAPARKCADGMKA